VIIKGSRNRNPYAGRRPKYREMILVHVVRVRNTSSAVEEMSDDMFSMEVSKTISAYKDDDRVYRENRRGKQGKPTSSKCSV